MDIGKNLTVLMEKKGLSQGQLAEMAGISQPHLCNVIKGKKCLSVMALKAIADECKVSMDELTK
jgi:transcriptional regulator with XRE-family HTH domain